MNRSSTWVVVAFGAVCLAACQRAAPVQTATVERRSLVVPILAEGSLEPPPGGEIRAAEPGVVGQIYVVEGQRVVRGQPLLRIDSPDLSQRALASRGESAQLSEEQQRSAIELAAGKRERDRLRSIVEADARLLKVGAITAEQRAADESSYQQAAEKAYQAELHVAEIAKRKQIVDDSTRELERRTSQMIIRAPSDGVVYNLPRSAGENVVPGQLVATIADPRRVRVRARVESPDLPRVRAGQRIIVTFDGLPNRKWDGSVVLVPPGLRDIGSRSVGEVLGELTGDTTGLPANASVNVEIIVGEKASALVIPRSALQRDGQTRFIYKLVNGKAQRTNVTAGLIGPTDAEILSGLQEGDRVILPGAAAIRDGQAVQAVSST